MKKEELIRKSIFIIKEYYNGNLEPFFDSFADHALWIGPREGQIISGKEKMIEAWGEEENELKFHLNNMSATAMSTGTSNLEVMLKYYVYTYFPNGEIDEHNQRMQLSWGYEKENGIRVPKVYLMNIANIPREALTKKNGVKIYASSFAESTIDAIHTSPFLHNDLQMIYGKGNRETIYYFNSATVIWIESTDHAQHTIVHTTEGTYQLVEKLRYFEEHFANVFLRVHTSYLINPFYVTKLRRFEVTMTDGTILPVPQKKYTAFKEKLNSWNQHH